MRRLSSPTLPTSMLWSWSRRRRLSGRRAWASARARSPSATTAPRWLMEAIRPRKGPYSERSSSTASRGWVGVLMPVAGTQRKSWP